jgi:hypothetical protein
MPLVFLHGFNVRKEDPSYEKNLTSRNFLFQRLLLAPLALRDKRFAGLKIINPYCGDLGINFAWSEPSIFATPCLESLEPNGPTTADLEFLGTVQQLMPGRIPLERLSTERNVLRQAADCDPQRFLESIVMRVALSEISLKLNDSETPEQEGWRQALLIEAARDVGVATTTEALIATAQSDEDLLSKLEQAVADRFQQLYRQEASVVGEASSRFLTGVPTSENMGSGSSTLRDRLSEVFDRALDATTRSTSATVQTALHDQVIRYVGRFVGNVFVYLHSRDNNELVKSIAGQVLDTIIRALDQECDGSPLLIVTHSMGGNILYDLLTYYARDLAVDLWVAVASQVGMLEGMKLFKGSDLKTVAPQKVSVRDLKPRLKRWVNVYDPMETLSFLAQPLFADVDADISYRSGMGLIQAHGAYFQRASFCELLLSQALTPKP